MKNLVLIVGLIIFSFSVGNAQHLSTTKASNDELLVLTNKLTKSNQDAAAKNDAQASFTLPMQQKIDSIKFRALNRKAFLKKLEDINTSFLPSVFKRGPYHAYNQRLKSEVTQLDNDKAYCKVLNDLLNAATFFSASKKVYYAKDNYSIPEEYISKAKEVFEPMIDKIIEISNAYPDKPFEALIQTTGYADDEPIEAYSAIYYDLLAKMNETKATNEELKYYLSHLRAKNLASILVDLIKEKKTTMLKPEMLTTTVKSVGAGILKERPTKDESAERAKEKSRVVKVYWDILPNF